MEPFFELQVSEIPVQFLKEEHIHWRAVGKKNKYRLDVTTFKRGTWLYWQVRAVDSSGKVLTTSEISSFKLTK